MKSGRVRAGAVMALVAATAVLAAGCGMFTRSVRGQVESMQREYDRTQAEYVARWRIFEQRAGRMNLLWGQLRFSLAPGQRRLYQGMLVSGGQGALEALMATLTLGQREILSRWAEEAAAARDDLQVLRRRDGDLSRRYEAMTMLVEEHVAARESRGNRPRVTAKVLERQQFAQQQRRHQLESVARKNLWRGLEGLLDVLQ